MKLCRNPYVDYSGRAFGCGQCVPCLVHRRGVWTHRILLEASQYSDNAFVGLSYDEDSKPVNEDGLGTLVPRDYQLWLKRLRKIVAPSRIRFFVVGEYGDETWRPHYHAALFGFPSCKYGQSQYSERRKSCCHWCDLVRDTWGHGFVHLGTLEKSSAEYLGGYITKKMTHKDDVRLQGRHPEFAKMSNGGGRSRNGGIGKDALWEIADVLLKHNCEKVLDDVPHVLRHGCKHLALGSYLRRELRKMVGGDGTLPEKEYKKMVEEMQPLLEAAKTSKDAPSVKSQILKANKQKVINLESRRKLWKKHRAL